MLTRLKIILAIMAAGLASPALADQDHWGNTYPSQCTVAATSALHLTFVPVSQHFLDVAAKTEHRVGLYLPSGAAAIRKDVFLDPALLADTKRHEACHRLMLLLTGSPNWHRKE